MPLNDGHFLHYKCLNVLFFTILWDIFPQVVCSFLPETYENLLFCQKYSLSERDQVFGGHLHRVSECERATVALCEND